MHERALSPYGYVTSAGEIVPADRETLLQLAGSKHPPYAVWTPESDGVVPPWQVPWLFERLMAPARESSLGQVKAFGLMAGLGLLVGGTEWIRNPGAAGGPPILLLVAFVWFGSALFEHIRLRRMTAAGFAAEVDEARRLPKGRTTTPVFTRALVVIIAIVAVAQLSVGAISLDRAALVKEAVRAGEWWRLFTAPLLHVTPTHLIFNGLALWVLGGLVERYTHRSYVPLVFLLTALAGGAASMLSERPSAGASGGIMGLMGFALVLSYKRRSLLPRRLSRDLLANIAWVAVMGLVAFQYIGNSAHAASLVSGALLGLLLIPGGGRTPHWEPGPVTRAAGWAAMGIVALSALQAVRVMVM